MPAPLLPAATNHSISLTKTMATDSLRQQIKHKAEPKKLRLIFTNNVNNNVKIKFFHQNMGFKYNVLEPCQAKNIANWYVCSHDQTNLEIICSKVVELRTALEMVARYKEFGGPKHVKMTVLRTLTTKSGGGRDSLVNQIN